MLGDGVLGPSRLSLEDEEFHELPYSTMLGKVPASPRNSSKRFACDRCRGQKLRCVREDTNHETCIRCLRMNAVCITNSPLRMGRPRRAETERRRRSTLVADGQTLIMTSDDHVLEMETGIGTATKPSWMPNAIPAGGQGPSDANPNDCSTNDISNNTLPSLESSDLHSWQAQGSESMGSIHETLGLADPGNRALSESNSVGDGSISILNWPSPSLDTTDVFADLTNRVSLSEDVFLTSLQPPASRPPTSPRNSAEMASPERGGSENSHDLSNTCPVLSGFAVPERSQIDQHSTQADTTSTESEKSPGKDCIHLLSELSLSLYRQLLRFNSNTVSPPLVPLTRSSTNAGMNDPNLIGNILHSSEEFLTLINGLLSSLHEPSESLPANVSFIPENFHHGSRDPHTRNISFYTQSLMKTSSPSFDFSLSASSSAGTGNVSSASSRPRQGFVGSTTAASFLSKPDTPVILLVITCYVQLIRIYSMIFSHVHSSLLATVSGHTPSLLNLPDFQISGFPLRSGILQVKILIEVVVHFLNHIEKGLGLPMEYRVSSRDGRSTGMLSDLDLTELFKMVIKQEERGEVKSLREHIKCMKHLLENC